MTEAMYYFIRSNIDLNIFKNLILRGEIDLDNSLTVLLEPSFASFLKAKGIKYVILDDYATHTNYGNLRKKVLNIIKAFPHKPIFDNKPLVELLEYDGYSLWWFIRQGFYSQCIKVIKEVYAIKSLVKNMKIKNITILNQDEEFANIVREAAKNLGINISTIDKKYLLKTNSILKNKREYLLDNIPRLIRIFQGFFRSLQISNKKKKWNLLIFTKSHVWSALNSNIRGDVHFYPIIRDLSESHKYAILPLDAAVTKDGAWKAIKEKKKPFIPYDYFIFKSFLDFYIRKKLKFLRSRLKSLWNKLDDNKLFRETLICDDISLYPILRQQIKSYFFDGFNSFISAARNIEIGKKILDDYSINMTICIDENGSARFLIFASRSMGIPSIGLQHGIMAPFGNVTYNYGKDDLFKYKGNLNCQLPDKTAVFGNYFKQMLIKNGNYKPDMVAVTGQPRMDIIYENKESYSKKELYKKLGIESGKKLVVYASQPVAGAKIAFSALVKALKNLKNAALVVKLHPADNPSLYKTVLKELKYEAIISKDMDLYKILICSDLVISIHSTVILEALALEKQVIQLNLTEKYEIFGELASKCIKKVTREHELLSAVRHLLYDKSSYKKLGKKRKKFILEYYHKIDGNSSRRFIGLINRLLTEK